MATAFHTPEWARVVTETYGFEDVSLRGAGGTLPLFHSRSPLFGAKLVSAVFNSYASPLFPDEDACGALVERATQRAAERGVAFLEIKAVGPLPERVVRELGLELRQPYRIDVLPLAPQGASEPALARRFRKHLRRAERRIRAAGYRLHASRAGEDVERFHPLLVRAYRDRHAMIAQPASLFRALARSFFARDRGRLWLAEAPDGRLAGGLLFLEHEGTATGCFGAIDPRLRALSLDALLKSAAIGDYARRGFARFDFGITSPHQPGVLFAKARFGPVRSATHHYYRLIRGRRVPETDYARAHAWLRRPYRLVPLPLARALPEWLVRHLN